MRVRAAETPKYATKQMSSEDTMPIGMALWGFFTSSPKRHGKTIKVAINNFLLCKHLSLKLF